MDKKMRTLDDLLEMRTVPEMRSNLEYRILEAARQSAERNIDQRRSFWAALKDSLILPAPSVSLATLLVVGVWVGFSVEVSQMVGADIESAYVQVSENSVYGDF